MALQTSGPISLDDIENEFGGFPPINISEYYRGGSQVPDTTTNSSIPTGGAISFDDFYGGDNTIPSSFAYNVSFVNSQNSGDRDTVCTSANNATIYSDSSSYNINNTWWSDAALTTGAPSGTYAITGPNGRVSFEMFLSLGSNGSNGTNEQACSFSRRRS